MRSLSTNLFLYLSSYFSRKVHYHPLFFLLVFFGLALVTAFAVDRVILLSVGRGCEEEEDEDDFGAVVPLLVCTLLGGVVVVVEGGGLGDDLRVVVVVVVDCFAFLRSNRSCFNSSFLSSMYSSNSAG